ncbi:hypothetical protein E2320_018251 [Naja naja]|nr:hypothetical protein E2320_018251 [Naja naja]
MDSIVHMTQHISPTQRAEIGTPTHPPTVNRGGQEGAAGRSQPPHNVDLPRNAGKRGSSGSYNWFFLVGVSKRGSRWLSGQSWDSGVLIGIRGHVPCWVGKVSRPPARFGIPFSKLNCPRKKGRAFPFSL